MSQESLEIVRGVVEALLGDDADLALARFDPEAEWHNTSEFPGPRVCRGREEIKAFWTALFEEFNRISMEIEDTMARGDSVAVAIHSRGSGKASGAPIDVRWASVYRVRSGTIVRVDVYGDYAKALDALGG